MTLGEYCAYSITGFSEDKPKIGLLNFKKVVSDYKSGSVNTHTFGGSDALPKHGSIYSGKVPKAKNPDYIKPKGNKIPNPGMRVGSMLETLPSYKDTLQEYKKLSEKAGWTYDYISRDQHSRNPKHTNDVYPRTACQEIW